MSDQLAILEKIVRATKHVGQTAASENLAIHPFDERNIHSEIGRVSIMLFNDGHYSQATFEAFKYLDLQVKIISRINDSGFKLMMNAFSEVSPKIKLTALTTQSEIDEQTGFKFVFAGAMSAIRNPRGHDINSDTIDRCLDHLSVASVLLRRLEGRSEP